MILYLGECVGIFYLGEYVGIFYLGEYICGDILPRRVCGDTLPRRVCWDILPRRVCGDILSLGLMLSMILERKSIAAVSGSYPRCGLSSILWLYRAPTFGSAAVSATRCILLYC